MLLALQPLAFVVISTRVDHSTLARCFVAQPITFVHATVLKTLLALSASFLLLRLAEVFAALWHSHRPSHFPPVLKLVQRLVEFEVVSIGPYLLGDGQGDFIVKVGWLEVMQSIRHELQL